MELSQDSGRLIYTVPDAHPVKIDISHSETIPDAITLTEVDEIDPHCSVVIDQKFQKTAAEFVEAVDLQGTKEIRPGKKMVAHLQMVLKVLHKNAASDLGYIEDCQRGNMKGDMKFSIFAGMIINKHNGSQTVAALMRAGLYEPVKKKIMGAILTKSIREAKQILYAMEQMIEELQTLLNEKRESNLLDGLESEQSSLLDPMDEGYQLRANAPATTNLLQLYRGRKHEVYGSIEAAAFKIFNYAVFKLAVIFERVRFYQTSVVQPRDNNLNVIEVNLNNKKTKMTQEGQRMTRIWEKNDFIMTYRVTQLIYDEIQRLEALNILKNAFADEIKDSLAKVAGPVAKREVKPTQSLNESKTNLFFSRPKEVDPRRATLQKYYLYQANDERLHQESEQILKDLWKEFSAGSMETQNIKPFSLNPNLTGQKVFIFLKVDAQEINMQNMSSRANYYYSFEMDILYQEKSSVSQKFKFQTDVLVDGRTGPIVQHDLLYIEVPFRVLAAANVTLIIKVYKNVQSPLPNEMDKVWLDGKTTDISQKRNVFKKAEGYALVNLSETFWKSKATCGLTFRPKVIFYEPDPNNIVDDKFETMYSDRSQVKHKVLNANLNFKLEFTLLSTLARSAINLQKANIVMMRKFMVSLMSKHRFKSSEFLETDPASSLVSYTNDQLYQLDMKLQPYMRNLNEIKLDLCCVEINQQPEFKFARAQIFLRKDGDGCKQELYDSIDGRENRKFSYQTQIAELHKKKLSFKETIFIRIPTKELHELRLYHIVIALQTPMFEGGLDQISQLSLSQILDRPDQIVFKTQYILEIPLFDRKKKSILPSRWIQEPDVYKFGSSSKRYSIKKSCVVDDIIRVKTVVVDMSVQVMSQSFTTDPCINYIISMYDSMKQNPLNALDLQNILKHVKRIDSSPKGVLVFFVEKLLTMLLEIFSQVRTEAGSNQIFEAILYLIDLLKSKDETTKGPKGRDSKAKEANKHAYIIDEFIKKKFRNSQTSHVYVKILYQMIQFADQLQQSTETGKLCAPVKEHFALFKHLPTMMSILFRSYEQEEALRKRRTKSSKLDMIAINKSVDRLSRSLDQKTVKGMQAHKQSEHRNTHHSLMITPKNMPQTYTDETRADIQLLAEELEGNSEVNQSQRRSEKVGTLILEEQVKESDVETAGFNRELFSASKQGELDAEELMQDVNAGDENDDIFSQIETVQNERSSEIESNSGFTQYNRRLTIVADEIIRKEKLLHMTSLSKNEFKSSIQIFLKKIATLLHTDHNNSCKQLRMIFYRHFSDILEDVIVYLDEKFLMTLIDYLVQPLRSPHDEKLAQTQRDMSVLIEGNRANRKSNRQSLQIENREPISTMFSKMKTEPDLNQTTLANNNTSSMDTSTFKHGRLIMTDYVSKKNFWFTDVIGNDTITLPEYVQRVITMGQFLESKAIEKLPKNPGLGRRIVKEFCKFVSECVADQSASSQVRAKFMENIDSTMKGHTLLYMMHQLFKHENRFAQVFDLTDMNKLIVPGQIGTAYNHFQVRTQTQRIRTESLEPIVEEEDFGGFGANDNELRNDYTDFETKDSGLNERLDLFIGDVDLYTSMLIQLDIEGGEEKMPDELIKSLYPVKEKSQLIIFQLISLFNSKNLSQFIDRKKQMKQLLQNMITMLTAGSMEFRMPYTQFGQEKKLHVFARFAQSLSDVFCSERNRGTILARKEIFRPIVCSLWLIQLLTYSNLLKIQYAKGDVTPVGYDQYQTNTWSLVLQFTRLWNQFRCKRSVLYLTQEYKQTYEMLINALVKSAEKEVRVGMYETLNVTIKVLLLNEEEAFNFMQNKGEKYDTELITQLIYISKQLMAISQDYADQSAQVEQDMYFETIFHQIVQKQIFKTTEDSKVQNVESFKEYLNDILQKFKAAERRMLLVLRARVLKDPLYEAYCEYEQLKIFLKLNLAYVESLFKKPFDDYDKLLRRLKQKMLSEREVKDLLEAFKGEAPSQMKSIENHYKTEIAFTKVREYELVEAKVKQGKIGLGSAKVGTDVRVKLIGDACNELRQNRFYLKAIELKEKQKQLLMQTFEYGAREDIEAILCRSCKPGVALTAHCPQCFTPHTQVQIVPLHNPNSGQNTGSTVFQTLGEENKIHKDIIRNIGGAKNFCEYFLVQFYGSHVPYEMKTAPHGFVLRGTPNADWFSITEDLQGLYRAVGKGNRRPYDKLVDRFKEGMISYMTEKQGMSDAQAEVRAEQDAKSALSNPSLSEHLMQAYDFDMIKFVSEEEPDPPLEKPGFHVRVMKVQPFSVAARKKYSIDEKECHKYGEISETLEQDTHYVSQEFEEYFNQNYKRQFYFDRRACNMELKQNFMILAQDLFKQIDKQREEAANEALKPDESLKVVKELGTHSEDLSYEECIEYYDLLCIYMYGREYREADFLKFWKDMRLQKKMDENKGEMPRADLLEAAGMDWELSKVQLHDLMVTVLEVEEDFPTMNNMQMIVKKKVAGIYGVEKEIMTWDGRIKSHQKIRAEVSQVYNTLQKPPALDTSITLTEAQQSARAADIRRFYMSVGPHLKTFSDTIRGDVDSKEKGGVMTSVEIFFPNDFVLEKMITDPKRKRITLELFVTMEKYLTEIHTSLQLFSKYNRDYDEYCVILNQTNKDVVLVKDHVVSWYSEFNSIKNQFEAVRRKCAIDQMLLDQEALEEDRMENDEPNDGSSVFIFNN